MVISSILPIFTNLLSHDGSRVGTTRDLGATCLSVSPQKPRLGVDRRIPLSRYVNQMALDNGCAAAVRPASSVLSPQRELAYTRVGAPIIGYLADNALAFAGGSLLGDCVTLEYKINYVRPATGGRLIAHASTVSSGKRIAVCECRISAVGAAGDTIVATALGTLSAVGRAEDG